MQPLGDVLQNSCSSPLLKKTVEPCLWETWYFLQQIKNSCTVFRFWISTGRGDFPRQESWGPEVAGGPRVQRSWDSQGSMGSWGTESPEVPGVLGVPGVLEVLGSQDWVPLFYHADSSVFKNALTSISIWRNSANLSSFTSRSDINVCWLPVSNKILIIQNWSSGLFMTHVLSVCNTIVVWFYTKQMAVCSLAGGVMLLWFWLELLALGLVYCEYFLGQHNAAWWFPSTLQQFSFSLTDSFNVSGL